jgi:hypothetical protein
MRKRAEWQELKPWESFFWDDHLPSGICLGCGGRPVALPPQWLADGEVFFAIRIRPQPLRSALLFVNYVFMIDPRRHTRRVVRREGYWSFGGRMTFSVPFPTVSG